MPARPAGLAARFIAVGLLLGALRSGVCAAADPGTVAHPGAEAGAAAGLALSLRQREPLRLVELVHAGGGSERALEGILEVTLVNRGRRSAVVRDLDVLGLLFTSVETGERFLVVHPCDCFFVAGETSPPPAVAARQVHRLAPEASAKVTIEEFGCSGTMWKPPPPGRYDLTYRVLPGSQYPEVSPPARPGRAPREVERECRELLLSAAYWQNAVVSPPLRIELLAPVRKKVEP